MRAVSIPGIAVRRPPVPPARPPVARPTPRPSRAGKLDEASGLLYLLEQNSLRGFGYETFRGDALSFCSRGRYDCSRAKNSGECGCLDGWGGSCCDVQLLSPLSGLVGQMQASVGVWVSALPALLAAAALLRFGLRQRHRAAALELRLEDRLAHLRRALIRDDERSERT